MANIQLGGSIGTTGAAILGSVNIALTDSNHTLSVAEYTNYFIYTTGSLTAVRDLILPLVRGLSFVIDNVTTGGFAIRAVGSSGQSVTIDNGTRKLIICDGTDYLSVGSGDSVGTVKTANLVGYGIIQSNLAEVGQYITNARFKATYNFSPTSVILTDNDGNPSKDVSGTPGSFFSDGYFQKNSFGDSVIFTINADGYTSDFEVVWGQRNYFGTGYPGNNSASFIKELNSVVNNSAETLFTVNAGPMEKIYFAHRTAYGTPSIFFNGFEGGFTVVSTTISITNPYGFTENYTLWESDNTNLGITSVEVY